MESTETAHELTGRESGVWKVQTHRSESPWVSFLGFLLKSDRFQE